MTHKLSEPKTITSKGDSITLPEPKIANDCKKAKLVLGATIRPVEETIRDVVESSFELGVVDPQFK